jgi:hypothetical protein
VSEVKVINPIINFVKGPHDRASQTQISGEWINVATALCGLPVNTMSVHGGEIWFHDFHVGPRISLKMDQVVMDASNLQNIDEKERVMSGLVEASGKVDDAHFHMTVELSAFYKSPMFKLNAELVDLDLAILQDFLRAYSDIDVDQGPFTVYTQARTRNEKVIGYVKPSIQDVNIATGPSLDKGRSLNQTSDSKAMLSLVEVAHKQRLDEIQFEGNLDDPDVNIWDAVGITLHNAFVEGLSTMLVKSMKDADPIPMTKRKRNTSKVSQSKDDNKASFLKRLWKRKENQ